MVGKAVRGVQISIVWTALGWMAAEASFWPAKLGARAIVAVFFGWNGIESKS